MSLYYFAITNEKNILCSHPITNDSFDSAVYSYLACHPTDQDICFNKDKVSFHCKTAQNLSFIAVTSQDTSRQQSKAFVDKVCDTFFKNSATLQTAKDGTERCLQSSYELILRDLMSRFDSFKENGSLNQLRSNVNTVTAVMQENTRLALQRGDRLNNLVSKTDELAVSFLTHKTHN
ncbi:unnamed protein product [Schistosoma turkestanicum]|nr:unnamed protein product [Schistosoma turkestanicum]